MPPRPGKNTLLHRLRRGLRKQRYVVSYLFKGSFSWSESEVDGVRTRRYRSYDDYLAHQKSKLEVLSDSPWLAKYDEKFHQVLSERLGEDGVLRHGMVALCLAARLGTEVKAFRDHGCFSLGVDLNPGRENPWVVYGDFHALQFPDRSVDVVYTNSLDHSLELGKVVAEIRRVLKPGGLFILEAGKGEQESPEGGAKFWEASTWKRVDDLVSIFTDAGFRIEGRRSFDFPWEGDHILLRVPG